MTVTGGTEDVGRAATRGVVGSILLVIGAWRFSKIEI